MSSVAFLRASRTHVGRILAQSTLLIRDFGGVACQLEASSSKNPSALPSLMQLRSFIGSPAALMAVQVAVPQLGESITEGSIAAILKQPGDRVEEDEPIMQIETDKVTIDVRAPQAGILEAILVKEEEDVTVGHLIAIINEEGAAPKAASAPAAEPAVAAAPAPETYVAAEVAAAPQTAAPAATSSSSPSRREPSIKFPPRRTAAGEVISMLPAEVAKGAVALAYHKPVPMAAPPKEPRLFVRVAPRPAGPPAPPRKDLSEWEIEQIMLGGADM